MNNHLKLRLANIAFSVLKIAKHWKTQDEVYTVQQWQKYCDKLQKRPKFTPIVVPAKVKERAERLRDKLVEEGKSMEEAKSVVQNKYSKKSVEEISEMTDKIFNKKKEEKRKQKEKEKENSPEEKAKRKEERRIKDIERKQNEREEHKKTYQECKSEGVFVYGGEKYKKVKTRFTESGEEIFNETFRVKVGGDKKPKNLLTKENEEELKNQLLQFHKGRSGNWRVRSNFQLQQEFLRKMDPSSYSSMREFNDAKQRVQNMNPNEFMAMVHSIWEDDDEENIVEKPQKTNKKSPSKQHPAVKKRPAKDIINESLNKQ